jgi:hypothetical protein
MTTRYDYRLSIVTEFAISQRKQGVSGKLPYREKIPPLAVDSARRPTRNLQ